MVHRGGLARKYYATNCKRSFRLLVLLKSYTDYISSDTSSMYSATIIIRDVSFLYIVSI